MNDIRKKISKFTRRLQLQKNLPLWSLANEQVIYSAAIGEKPKWGSNSNILFRIMGIAHKIYLSDFIIFFVGFSRVISIWWGIKKSTFKTKKLTTFKKVFAGFGASSEEYFYADYISQSKDPVLRINWITYDGMNELACPKLVSMFSTLIRNAFGYSSKLNKAISEVSSNAVDFLTVCALNIGAYAFYRSYWRIAKSCGVEEVAFLTPDILSFSCVDEGIKTIYFQHGLLGFSILFPKVDTIQVITEAEENYLKGLLNDAQIFRATRMIKNADNKHNVIMLLSVNVFQKERLLICEPLVHWAISKGLTIVVRPTQKVSEAEKVYIHKNVRNALFDDIKSTLDASLEKWRPKLVAAWSSTGLATALEHGCLPISLYDPDVNDVWNNMIYPMKNRVLFWPRDKALIEMAMQSETSYNSQLMNLRSYHESCLV